MSSSARVISANSLWRCAVVTGVLNSMLVYVVAYHVQLTTTKMTCRLRCRPIPDVEAARAQTNVADLEPPQNLAQRGFLRHGSGYTDAQLGNGTGEDPCQDRFQKHISDTSTLCTMSGYVSDLNGSKSANKEHIRSANENQDDTCWPNNSQLHLHDGHQASNTNVDTLAPRASPPGRVSGIIYTWLSQNVFLTLSLLLLLLIGLPVSFFQQNDLYLDVGFLFTAWLTFTSAQVRTKQHIHLENRHRKTLTAVATLLNPVLWTSLFLVCYGLAKSSIRNQSSAAVIASFTTKNTVSDLIANHIDSPAPAAGKGPRLGSLPIGAGDVATSILNAGIVSWGLKLFEYRHQIVSSGGFTVVLTSLLASLVNVVAWPLLAFALGVRPASWDLSFAARSVTIALGGPAMKSLGGDAGINAVGVVVNGICFQLVAGFFPGGNGLAAAAGRIKKACIHDGWAGLVWNSRVGEQREMELMAPCQDREQILREAHMDGVLQPGHERETRYSSDATHVDKQRPDEQNDIASWGTAGTTANKKKKNGNNMVSNVITGTKHNGDRPKDTASNNSLSVVPTVAAGVTIGINAAAMGTAHLYEQNSHAAPYSALSMTTFGVFTVLFAVRGPMTEWLVKAVGGGQAEAVMML